MSRLGILDPDSGKLGAQGRDVLAGSRQTDLPVAGSAPRPSTAAWLYAAAVDFLVLLFAICLAEAALQFAISAATGHTIEDAIEATCRITATDGGCGTGCIFAGGADYYDILTNAHVVGGGPGASVECEFWLDGYASHPIRGTVVQSWLVERSNVDIAVVRVAKSAFPRAMKPVPLAPGDAALATATIYSVGCSGGNWPTAWKGRVLANAGRPAVVDFVPAPAGGRSGSALFASQDGRLAIVGLIAWRSADDRHGIAMHTGTIYHTFQGGAARVYAASEWDGRRRTETHETGVCAVCAQCQHGVALNQPCQSCGPWGCDPRRGGGRHDAPPRFEYGSPWAAPPGGPHGDGGYGGPQGGGQYQYTPPGDGQLKPPGAAPPSDLPGLPWREKIEEAIETLKKQKQDRGEYLTAGDLAGYAKSDDMPRSIDTSQFATRDDLAARVKQIHAAIDERIIDVVSGTNGRIDDELGGIHARLRSLVVGVAPAVFGLPPAIVAASALFGPPGVLLAGLAWWRAKKRFRGTSGAGGPRAEPFR